MGGRPLHVRSWVPYVSDPLRTACARVLVDTLLYKAAETQCIRQFATISWDIESVMAKLELERDMTSQKSWPEISRHLAR